MKFAVYSGWVVFAVLATMNKIVFDKGCGAVLKINDFMTNTKFMKFLQGCHVTGDSTRGKVTILTIILELI
ncbi:hypothetical protein D3C78_1580350 [compost metagenome]